MNANMRIVQALLRHDLRAFVHKVFVALTLGQTYVRNWHIDAIIYQLERIRRGESPAYHQYATAQLKIDHGIGRLSRLLAGSRSNKAHHLCELFRRPCEKALVISALSLSPPGIGRYFPTHASVSIRTPRRKSNSPSAAFAWRPRSAAR